MVVLAVTLNDITCTFTDSEQPSRIDELAVYFPNDRPFDLVSLAVACKCRCACPADLTGDEQIDLEDLQVVAGILLQAGSPFIVEVEPGRCGDLNNDEQIDLEDLQAVAGILLDAGSPFIVPCK